MKRWTLIGVLAAMLIGCFEALFRYACDGDIGPVAPRRP